jgi:hypothetical protein
MSNAYNNPIILDTDITSYRTGAGVTIGIRVLKLILAVGGSASSAGSVAIVNPENSQVLYPPIPVANSTAANTIVLTDNPTGQGVMSWPDFKVTGLTATGTKLYIWFGL